ncbi:alpha/beta fold hydrolase [Nocardia macrotermitis]|uniref:Putative hydrolase n=1 Tax=Nocardia macrotermitis TaxID=2585198 RepID=A0A7K0D8I6_9NOCA|nr:alpha/beta fold hydrolase [Nocardia macrotermitis]MQY22090.1 putative hydrolase [Nocardia macrotermitis]
MRPDIFAVPGATIYHEIRGAGPVLLVLPGGGGDANGSDELAELLAPYATVVTMDARGYSRSVLDSGQPEQQHVRVQSEDAYLLLRHLTDEPAHVVGMSAGGIVGLDLLARHPDSVRALVAHDPPCFAVLPDAAEQRAFVTEVSHLARTEGIPAAAQRFLDGIGGAMAPTPAPDARTPQEAAMWARLAANAPIMMEYELCEFTSYIPDFAALATAVDRLTLGVSADSRQLLPSRPAARIAARLGLEVVEFPGMHNGARTHTREFATRVIEVLGIQRCAGGRSIQ